jgi:acyl-CoA thioesterase II
MRTVDELQNRFDRLVALMRPTATGLDTFRGERGELNLPRIFGGEVLGQGLMAAAATVDPAKTAHSLHAYFLRAGQPDEPVTYRVTRLRDGRRFAVRSITADQHGSVLATMTASFADTAGGVTHQRRPPAAPAPDQLATLTEASEAWGGLGPSWYGFDPMEIRLDPRQVRPGEGDLEAWTDRVWQRMARPLPDDPVLHQALLVYASDILQLASALVPHGLPLGREEVSPDGFDGVSLDHAVWFHRPVRVDEWLLFEQCSPVAGGGRAFTRAEIFSPDGDLVASVAQEGLIFGIGAGG